MSAWQDKADIHESPPADVLAALAVDEIEVIEFPAKAEDETRIELRRNKRGQLRGIVWRKRGKDRKAVYYVGAKARGERRRQWEELHAVFGGIDGRPGVGNDSIGRKGVGSAR